MTPQEEGRLLATVDQIALTLRETRDDVKDIITSQTRTEERLRGGVEHFKRVDNKLEECETKIEEKAGWKGVYTAIGLGFTILLAVITIYKFWG